VAVAVQEREYPNQRSILSGQLKKILKDMTFSNCDLRVRWLRTADRYSLVPKIMAAQLRIRKAFYHYAFGRTRIID
jgi:hypothetical protein